MKYKFFLLLILMIPSLCFAESMVLTFFLDRTKSQFSVSHITKEYKKMWRFDVTKSGLESQITRGKGENDWYLRDMHEKIHPYFSNQFIASHKAHDWFIPPYPVFAMTPLFQDLAVKNDYAITFQKTEDNKLFYRHEMCLWKPSK